MPKPTPKVARYRLIGVAFAGLLLVCLSQVISLFFLYGKRAAAASLFLLLAGSLFFAFIDFLAANRTGIFNAGNLLYAGVFIALADYALNIAADYALNIAFSLLSPIINWLIIVAYTIYFICLFRQIRRMKPTE